MNRLGLVPTKADFTPAPTVSTQTLQVPRQQHLTEIITVTWRATCQWPSKPSQPGLSLLPSSFGGWSSAPVVVHQNYKGTTVCWEGTEQGYFQLHCQHISAVPSGEKTHWKSWLNSPVNIIKLLLNHMTFAKFEAQTTKLVYRLYAE